MSSLYPTEVCHMVNECVPIGCVDFGAVERLQNFQDNVIFSLAPLKIDANGFQSRCAEVGELITLNKIYKPNCFGLGVQ